MAFWKSSLFLLGLMCIQPTLQAESPCSTPTNETEAEISVEFSSSCLQALLEHEDARKFDVELFSDASQSLNAAISKRAHLAMGRIGDPAAGELLIHALSDKRTNVRESAAFALGLIPGEKVLAALRKSLQNETHPTMIATVITALSKMGTQEDVSVFEGFLFHESSRLVVGAAAEGLGILWQNNSKSSEWPFAPSTLSKLVALLPDNGLVGENAAFALNRFPGKVEHYPETEIINAMRKVKNASVRALLARVLRKIKTPAAIDELTSLLAYEGNVGVRVQIIRALGFLVDEKEKVLFALKDSLNDRNVQVVIESLEAFKRIFKSETAIPEHILKSILTLAKKSSSPWVRGEALLLLSQLSPTQAKSEVYRVIASGKNHHKISAIKALAHLEVINEDLLSKFTLSPDLNESNAAIEAILALPEEKISVDLRAAVRAVLDRKDFGQVCLIAGTLSTHKWTDFAAPLASLYEYYEKENQSDGKICVLTGIGHLQANEHLPIVERGLGDPEKPVVVAAADAYKALTQTDVSDRIPVNSRIETQTPTAEEVAAALGKKVVLHTTKGDITFSFSEWAPLTVVNFINLVETGYYTGVTFHRVISNFVIQGGDPRGDGSGGPGYSIREEISPLRHARGTIGMATSGKDTAGSQFFVNTGTNIQLNGNYTVFGEVISGMKVVDKIEIGDVILKAEVVNETKNHPSH
jgi:cyclophilin family peptidyl-prolyl cis-trans isomerase/HEAT repeat protein